MARLDFSADDWQALVSHLLRDRLEQGAFCLAEPVCSRGELRLLVREVVPVPPGRLIAQTGSYLETDPLFFAPIVKRARAERYSLVIAHSHPVSHGRVAFSSIDDGGEAELIPKVQARAPSLPHATLVVAHNTAAGRIYETGENTPAVASVHVIDMPLREIGPGGEVAHSGRKARRFDRQLRAWGQDVQERLGSLRVGVVGHGGTGSHVALQLRHLGIPTLVVDPDRVDETSLNRLVGSTTADAETSVTKVGIAARSSRALGHEMQTLARSVLEQETALAVANCDVVFGCTDDLASRKLLNRLALQYYIPLIDLGMDLERGADGALRNGAGRVTLVLPDGPCLHRAGVLVGDEPPAGYVADDPRPAVIAFNGVISSLAVVTLLALAGAIPMSETRQVNYLPFKARLMHESIRGLCADCIDIRGVGASRPLPWSYGEAAEGAA